MSDIELINGVPLIVADSDDLTYEQQVAAFPDPFDSNPLMDNLLYNPQDPEANLLDNSFYLLDELYELKSDDLIDRNKKELFVNMLHLENEIIAIAARVSKKLGLYSSGNYEAYAQIVAESLYDLAVVAGVRESEVKQVF